MAAAEDLARCAEAGAQLLTHLGNGVATTLDRHHNPIMAGLAHDGLHASLITDGHHLPADLIKVFLRAKTIERSVVVSDISSLGGMPPGDYKHGARSADADDSEIVRMEPDGKLHMPSRGVLAGSASTILQCMNHLHSLRLLSKAELLQLSFGNPLRLLGLATGDVDCTPRLRFTEVGGFEPVVAE